jgi:serine/threonine protein kinase
MEDLIQDMVQKDPSKRPTMDDVVERSQAIFSRLSKIKLSSPLLRRKDALPLRMIKGLMFYGREFLRPGTESR